MARWIENDIGRPEARGQMVIAQNQVRRTVWQPQYWPGNTNPAASSPALGCYEFGPVGAVTA
jgi:hypothetical protein